jgi:excisionase family DNA binding protein
MGYRNIMIPVETPEGVTKSTMTTEKTPKSTATGYDRSTPGASVPEWLRAEEAADLLGVSRGLVFELCRRGELPHRRLGRLLRVHRDGVRPAVAGKPSTR